MVTAGYFRISGASNFELRQPEDVERIKTKNIKRAYFWKNTAVLDEGKNVDEIMLSGSQYSTPSDTPGTLYFTMQTLEDIVNDGLEVEITGLKNPNFNGDYLIKDFDYGEEGGSPDVYQWTLILERVR